MLNSIITIKNRFEKTLYREIAYQNHDSYIFNITTILEFQIATPPRVIDVSTQLIRHSIQEGQI